MLEVVISVFWIIVGYFTMIVFLNHNPYFSYKTNEIKLAIALGYWTGETDKEEKIKKDEISKIYS